VSAAPKATWIRSATGLQSLAGKILFWVHHLRRYQELGVGCRGSKPRAFLAPIN